jgi:hypothetical protein
MFSDDVFDGTLLDGEMVKTNTGSWIYLVNDVMVYCGNHLVAKTLPQRLDIIYELLRDKYTPDADVDVCQFQVKRYTQASQEGVNKLIELSQELPYTCRGVYFWSFSLKYKPKLHNFDLSIIKPVIRKVKDTPDFREKPSSTSDHIEPAIPLDTTAPVHVVDKDDRVLWLRKTEFPDVYEVFGVLVTRAKKTVSRRCVQSSLNF